MKTNSPLGFSMPHSPLNQNDSIAATKAFKLDTENYMKRKFRGNNPKLGPITPEENLAEAKREQSEKYYNIEEKRLKLIPTDDREVQDESFKSKLKKWQLAPKKSPLPRHHGTYKVGDRLSDKDVHNYEAKFHGLASPGRGLKAGDTSNIQEDKHGQYATWEREVRRGKDRGEIETDTIRPVKKTAGGLFNPKYPPGYHTFKKN